MRKSIMIGGLLLAQYSMQGCLEATSQRNEETAPMQVDLSRKVAEQAFPGRSGTLATGYYRGQKITYEIIDGHNILEGDIILDNSEILKEPPAPGKESGAAANSGRWANAVIPYTIAAGLPNQQRVTDAINHWSYKFTFVQRTNQADYITFRPSDVTGTCSSPVGRRGGQQFINMDGCSTGSTVHELGHSIGLYHEMTRADRDNWVTINTGNIIAGKAHNFDKYSSGFDWQPFDFNSIMMYPATAFGKVVNGVEQTTIVANDGRTWGAQRSGLSDGDISTVEKMYPSGSPMWISTVSLDNNRMDVFAASSSGAISTAAHDATIDAGHAFRGWWSIQGGATAPGGAVNGISRAANKLDVFTVGTDNRVYTAAWDHFVANGAWRGWWAVGSNLAVYPGSHVVPVARTANNLDVFAVGKDGGIYTAAWDHAVDGANGFRGWWQILGGISLSGGQLSAITRGANALDVYAIGTDGNVYQASWSGGATWGGWWSLGNPGTLVHHVTALARGQKIDLFAVGFDRGMYHRAWNGSSWTNWANLGGVSAAGSRVAAVSRSSNRVDAFVLGTDNKVYTNGRTDGGAWSGWASVSNGQARAGAQVSAVARSNKMDVFITSTDNRIWTAGWTTAGWSGWYILP